MTQWHMKSKRKATGGIDRSQSRSDKKLSWKGGDASHTTIDLVKGIDRKTVRGLGSTSKVKLKSDKTILATGKDHKTKRFELITVVQNNADRQFARRNIMTKGAIVRVKDGASEAYAVVTSRPGQHGTIHGKILENFVPDKEKAENKEKKSKKAEKLKKEPKKAKKEK